MTTISPEAFMAQPTEPDEEDVLVLSGRELTLPPEMPPYDPNPLDSIATSLRQLVEIHSGNAVVEAENDGLAEVAAAAREAYEDLLAQHVTLQALLEEIETIIKPSVSKLANEVRAAIKAWRDPEVPTETAGEVLDRVVLDGVPAHDAPVEVWREFAVGEGLPRDAIEGMNRSQIRTALGITQPVEDGA